MLLFLPDAATHIKTGIHIPDKIETFENLAKAAQTNVWVLERILNHNKLSDFHTFW